MNSLKYTSNKQTNNCIEMKWIEWKHLQVLSCYALHIRSNDPIIIVVLLLFLVHSHRSTNNSIAHCAHLMHEKTNSNLNLNKKRENKWKTIFNIMRGAWNYIWTAINKQALLQSNRWWWLYIVMVHVHWSIRMHCSNFSFTHTQTYILFHRNPNKSASVRKKICHVNRFEFSSLSMRKNHTAWYFRVDHRIELKL